MNAEAAHVLPSNAAADTGHRPIRYAEALTERDRGCAETPEHSDLTRRIVRQFGSAMLDAARLTIPSLRHHVVDVVLPRAQEQMGRVYARRIVAAVKDPEPRRDLAVRDLPRHAMRQPLARMAAIPTNLTISAAVGVAQPRPALVRSSASNLSPETSDEGNCYAAHWAQNSSGIGHAQRCIRCLGVLPAARVRR